MNAAEYRQQALMNEMVYDLPMSTPGVIWKVRKCPIQQYYFAGELPGFLAAQIARAIVEGGEVETEKMSKDDLEATNKFTRDAIIECSVEPKITQTPTDASIGIREISTEDFAILRNWVITGGEAEADKFRSERYGVFMARADVPGLPAKSKRAAKS